MASQQVFRQSFLPFFLHVPSFLSFRQRSFLQPFVHFFVIFFLLHVSTSLHLFLPFFMRSLRPSHCSGEGEDGGDAGDDVGGGPAHVPTQSLARQSVVFMRSPLAAVMRQAMRSLKSMSAAGSSAAG